MRFCDIDACVGCSLANQPDMAPCLRHKAHFCLWLSRTQNTKSRAALEELGFELMDEARALAREVSIPAAAIN